MNEIARQAISIDPEFAAIWGNLEDEAFDGLKKEIYMDGIRDSLVLWKVDGRNILIDGHNRLRVAELLHMNAIPVVWKEFKDKAEAAMWILDHQSHRRNITDGQKYVAAEKVQGILREKAKEGIHKAGRKSLENSPTIKPEEKINVRKEVSKASGLSEWKVRQGDYIRENAPEKLEDLRTGKTTLKDAYKEAVKKTAEKKQKEPVIVNDEKAHEEAEKRFKKQKAQQTKDSILNIIQRCQMLTDDGIDAYMEVFSDDETFQDDMQRLKEVAEKLLKISETK